MRYFTALARVTALHPPLSALHSPHLTVQEEEEEVEVGSEEQPSIVMEPLTIEVEEGETIMLPCTVDRLGEA